MLYEFIIRCLSRVMRIFRNRVYPHYQLNEEFKDMIEYCIYCVGAFCTPKEYAEIQRTGYINTEIQMRMIKVFTMLERMKRSGR